MPYYLVKSVAMSYQDIAIIQADDLTALVPKLVALNVPPSAEITDITHLLFDEQGVYMVYTHEAGVEEIMEGLKNANLMHGDEEN